MGRCPQCGSWNSMVEEVIATSAKKSKTVLPGLGGASTPRRLSEIGEGVNERLLLPIQEFARVLGGGIVPGSIVLIGGDPGIGKSTLLLQTAGKNPSGKLRCAPCAYRAGRIAAVRNYRMICFWSPRPIWM
jgi:DNA repair protein RadA/Sms